MNRMKWFFLLGMVLMLMGTLMVPGPVKAADTIKVGIILPLTGGEAAFGEIEKNSFMMAFKEIQKAGGLKGTKIELLFEDDTGKPDIARAAAEKAHLQ